MFISAKAFFDKNIDYNITLLRRAETAIPEEFVRLYKKNVVKITPKRTGALRRSIITQALGNTAQIAWRSAYAKAQDEGGHTQRNKVKGINSKTGKGGTIMPGPYRYSNYTDKRTGPHFARIAFQATTEQMPEAYRRLGLIK